jgi:hypothetical protein
MNQRPILASIALAALLAGVTTTARADPPGWARAHGHGHGHGHHVKKTRVHRYVYYPEQRVYYAPVTQTWFWMNGGNWQVGVNLPHQFRIGAQVAGIPVTLQSSRPYVEHVHVEETYGRPWREAHHRKHKHKKHRHDH